MTAQPPPGRPSSRRPSARLSDQHLASLRRAPPASCRSRRTVAGCQESWGKTIKINYGPYKNKGWCHCVHTLQYHEHGGTDVTLMRMSRIICKHLPHFKPKHLTCSTQRPLQPRAADGWPPGTCGGSHPQIRIEIQIRRRASWQPRRRRMCSGTRRKRLPMQQRPGQDLGVGRGKGREETGPGWFSSHFLGIWSNSSDIAPLRISNP